MTQIMPPIDQLVLDEALPQIRDALPGGWLIVENWHAQPWTYLYLDPLYLHEKRPRLTCALLGAYPGIDAPVVTDKGYHLATFQVVPLFVRQYLIMAQSVPEGGLGLHRHEDVDDVLLAGTHTLPAPRWETYPGLDGIATAIAAGWSSRATGYRPDPAAVDPIRSLLTTAGPAGLLSVYTHLEQMPPSRYADYRQGLIDLAAAWAAAAEH